MEENAYQLLGLEQGPAATEAEIKKAYRKLALAKHPDKNPDNPRAADEFTALQKAYEILTDTGARAALDALVKAKAARVQRQAGHDEKRRRMMADLERREKGWEAARTQEESARAKLAAEMERLRRQAAEKAAQKAAEQRAAAQAASAVAEHGSVTGGGAAVPQQGQEQPGFAGGAPAAFGGAAAAASQATRVLTDELRERLSRTLKVSWMRKEGEYGAAQLRQIFSVYGAVEDVVLREGKKRKGSALVVMAEAAGAAAAASAVNGPLSNPLLVVPFNKAMPVEGEGAGGGRGEDASSLEGGPANVPAGRAAASVFPAAHALLQRAASPAAGAEGAAVPPGSTQAAAAAAAANGGAGSGLPAGLGPPPAQAPLFAAGGAGSGLPNQRRAASPLFPIASGNGGGNRMGGSSRPVFAAGAAQSGTQQPLVRADGGGGASWQPPQSTMHPAEHQSEQQPSAQGGMGPLSSSAATFASFASFRPSSAATAVAALNGGLEDATLQRMRQAAERRRLVEEMERQEA